MSSQSESKEGDRQMHPGEQQKLDETIKRVAAYWGWTPEKLLKFMEGRIAERDYYTLWALGAFPVINTILCEALAEL